MLENGPECICEPGYEEYEDGQCLKPSNETTLSDGECDQDTDWWGEWLNSDDPNGAGDWETLGGFDQSFVCENPKAIEARRTDSSTTPLVTHISKELGFWCINDEQDGSPCADFEVRVCCPKYQAGSDCNEEGFGWTQWTNRDDPGDTGDWETLSSYGTSDVCSSPIGVEARMADATMMASIGQSSSVMTHIDSSLGFWCLNEENQGGCPDYEARFCCPALSGEVNKTKYVMDGTCDDESYMWTGWLNTNSPVNSTGDWETLGNMVRMNVCASPSGIQVCGDGNVFFV